MCLQSVCSTPLYHPCMLLQNECNFSTPDTFPWKEKGREGMHAKNNKNIICTSIRSSRKEN